MHKHAPLVIPDLFTATRIQHDIYLKLLQEDTTKRIEEAIHKNIEEKLNSEEVKIEIERCIEEGKKNWLIM
ncbi:hypothetical protein RDABS01_016735 [Bienertia sinuspersici]